MLSLMTILPDPRYDMICLYDKASYFKLVVILLIGIRAQLYYHGYSFTSQHVVMRLHRHLVEWYT
jgi:hypothetical protein